MSRFILRSSITAVLVSLTFLCSPRGLAQPPQGDRPPMRPDDRGGFADKPVEEVKKNIQVLKGLPASQLTSVMNLMGGSLGVECKFCHYADESGIHFESDSVFAKRTAREMIRMTKGLNEQFFHGRPQVTCFTCHRGSTDPKSVVPLPLAAHEQPEEEPKGESALPKTETVLTQYEHALGGADALNKITSRVIKGTSVNERGEVPVEIYQKGPDKFTSSMIMRNGSASTRGFDGKKGWMSGDRGTRVLSDAESVRLERDAPLFPLARLRKLGDAAKVRGIDTVNGKRAYVIVARPDEHTRERYYIDSTTGLLLRRVVLTETMLGFVPEQVDYDDYRTVDGVKVPFVATSAYIEQDGTTIRRITSMEQNVVIDDKKFSAPEEKK